MKARVTITLEIYDTAIEMLMKEHGYKTYTKEQVKELMSTLSTDELYEYASGWPRKIEVSI